MRVAGDNIAGILAQMMAGRFMAMEMTMSRTRSGRSRGGRLGGRRRVVTHIYYLLSPRRDVLVTLLKALEIVEAMSESFGLRWLLGGKRSDCRYLIGTMTAACQGRIE